MARTDDDTRPRRRARRDRRRGAGAGTRRIHRAGLRGVRGRRRDAPAARPAGALQVLRRGLAASPELRDGLKATIVFAIVAALGKLAIPILIQLILDRGVLGSGGFRAGFVLLACLGAVVITIGVLFVSRIAYFRLVRAAEQALCNLRVRVFDHIHRLSIAEHTRRGAACSCRASRATSRRSPGSCSGG